MGLPNYCMAELVYKNIELAGAFVAVFMEFVFFYKTKSKCKNCGRQKAVRRHPSDCFGWCRRSGNVLCQALGIQVKVVGSA